MLLCLPRPSLAKLVPESHVQSVNDRKPVCANLFRLCGLEGMAAEDWPSIVADENSETGLVEQRTKSKRPRHHAKSGKLEWSLRAWKLEALRSAFKPTTANLFDSPPPSGVNLSFHDLSYSVKMGIRRGELILFYFTTINYFYRDETNSPSGSW